jgi:hypothetical protein
MNISQQVIILSADQNDNNHERNRQLHENLKACLDDCNLRFKEATGAYKGKTEDSVVVIVNNETDIETVKNFAFKSFNQESVLHQDANQEAYLVYADGTTEQVGRLEQVNPKRVETLENYVVLDGKVYTTIKR